MSTQEESILGLENLVNQCHGLYNFAPTIHGNKLVSIRVIVTRIQGKLSLSLWERKLQNPDQHIS
jgi:hypothetical protein